MDIYDYMFMLTKDKKLFYKTCNKLIKKMNKITTQLALQRPCSLADAKCVLSSALQNGKINMEDSVENIVKELNKFEEK